MHDQSHRASLSDEALSILQLMRGDSAGALARARQLEQRIVRASATRDAQRASALIAIIDASDALGHDRYQQAIRHLEPAFEFARDADDDDVHVRALRLLAICYRCMRRWASFNRTIARALAVARDLEDRRLTVTLMFDAVVARDRNGDPEGALRILDDIADDYHATRPETPEWNGLMFALRRSHLLTRCGRPHETLAVIDDALARYDVLQARIILPTMLAQYAEAMRAAGLPRSVDTLADLAAWAEDVGHNDVVFRFRVEEAHQLSATNPGAALALGEMALEGGVPVEGGEGADALLRAMSDWAASVGDYPAALEFSRRRAEDLQARLHADAEASIELVELELEHASLKRMHHEERSRARELEAIVSQLSDLQVDVETLLRDAVHDLGGPLTALEFATEGLAHVHGPMRTQRSLQYVRSAVDSVRDIVAGLARRKPPASADTPQFTRLSRLVRVSMPTFEAMAAAKGSALASRCEVDVAVAGDPSKVRRILTNLVSNAIKFSPAGAAIEVRVVRSEGGITLHVADEGPGFPEDFAATIERNAVGPARPTGGESSEGIGLDIVLRYCRAIGADVHFETTTRGGLVSVVFHDMEAAQLRSDARHRPGVTE